MAVWSFVDPGMKYRGSLEFRSREAVMATRAGGLKAV